ncbi:CMP-N-acetylneuraminate-beta-galactosamide-alpha-2,3-sialyltransferase 1-like [Anabas testudineus]|uniref:CMP-N-acetylneuraminate-beta-galactosamide-alpha-2,3-sialyltransferase 1 n=1 Tax=Anabas testudineus TaxID=64144 RepID=A0A3Q1I2T4_ANATE|nr:CMP-N-acetylneuraminate-beta-galactosamide-alpha-2,3-sialyltransferase 1-like [Anabas testudineus]
MAHLMSKWQVLTILLCITAIGVFLRHPNSGMFSHDFQKPVANSCACGKCLSENDTWFIKRFNPSVRPFLAANCHLSKNTFNWWKLLQNERRSFTTYRKTVHMLFQIFPPSPDLLEPRPQQCRTCAVVGNSVNLKGSHYGRHIDVHDIIIRMNYGQTKGYEADVGNRTTHRIMYPESATDLDSTTHLVLFPFKIQDLEWLSRAVTSRFPGKKYGSVKSVITANKHLVMVLNPAFMKYVHETWLDKKGKYPSTGFMAVVLALHICGKVNVFGYGADKDGNWSHYWEKLTKKNFKTGEHPGSYEYEIIQKLAKKRKISFYTRW